MKKIMFSDRFNLTNAVLSGGKTMTRRIEPVCKVIPDGITLGYDKFEIKPWGELLRINRRTGSILKDKLRYKVGEVVAVAQCYSEVVREFPTYDQVKCFRGSASWNNKMFVMPELMPHQIRITNLRVQRLQDISDEDCLKEHLIDPRMLDFITRSSRYVLANDETSLYFESPRATFARLYDRMNGKGLWEQNPWVIAYEFELVNE